MSGGSTPEAFLRRLAQTPDLPWAQTELYWVDERRVPPDDPASNYGLARRTLLEHVPVAAGNVHPMRAAADPDSDAAAYEELLRRTGADAGLDFCQLGVGADGHTASLFPGDPALSEARRLVRHTRSPAGVRDRLTLTLPMINRSRLAVVLVVGRAKAEVLARLVRGTGEPPLPCQLVRPAGRLLILADEAAAARLA